MNYPGYMREWHRLLLVLIFQVILLRMEGELQAFAAMGGTVFASYLLGMSVRKIYGTAAGLLLLLSPVLFLQILTGGLRWTVLMNWSAYAARLTAAALIARLYFLRRGTLGVQSAVAEVMRPFPYGIRRPVHHIFGSSLFLIPLVVERLRQSLGAGRVRFQYGKASPLTVLPRVLGAALMNITTIPERRAEAMVVRGVLETDSRPSSERGLTP